MKPLAWLEWEWLSAPQELELRERGPLPEGVTSTRIERDPDMQIVVTATGENIPDNVMRRVSQDDGSNRIPGQLIEPPADVVCAQFDGLVRLPGVTVRNVAWTTRGRDSSSIRVDAEGFRAVKVASRASPVAYADWVLNADFDPFMATRPTRREETCHYKRTRDGAPSFEMDQPSQELSLDHCRLEVSDHSGRRLVVRFGVVPREVGPKPLKPGFLEYEGEPSEDESTRVREVLSFVLGRHLVSVGGTSFADSNLPVQYVAVSAGSLFSKRICTQPSMPPTRDVALRGEGPFVDEERLARVLSGLLGVTKEQDLVHSLFLFWLGRGTYLDAAAAHLGAALESLRDAYAQGTRKLGQWLLPKEEWRGICEPTLAAFDAAIVSGRRADSRTTEALRILRTKVQALNEKSSNMKYDEFFAALGLPFGEVERVALRERNLPAHGTKYSKEQYPSLLSRVRALETLFARCVLKMSGAAETYIDYSTQGHPDRALTEPLGGPRGDGRSG